MTISEGFDSFSGLSSDDEYEEIEEELEISLPETPASGLTMAAASRQKSTAARSGARPKHTSAAHVPAEDPARAVPHPQHTAPLQKRLSFANAVIEHSRGRPSTSRRLESDDDTSPHSASRRRDAHEDFSDVHFDAGEDSYVSEAGHYDASHFEGDDGEDRSVSVSADRRNTRGTSRDGRDEESADVSTDEPSRQGSRKSGQAKAATSRRTAHAMSHSKPSSRQPLVEESEYQFEETPGWDYAPTEPAPPKKSSPSGAHNVDEPAKRLKDARKRKRSPPPSEEQFESLARKLREEAGRLEPGEYDEELMEIARSRVGQSKAARRKSIFVRQKIDTPEKSRRPQRRTVPPVQFWRNEKIEYEEDEYGLPTAKGVVKKVRPPMLNAHGEPVEEEDPSIVAPASKRPKHVPDLVLFDLANPEHGGEVQTMITAAPGEWIKYGPRKDWVPFAESDLYEPTHALAFYVQRDTMSESLVLEINPGSQIDFANEGYHGRRTCSVLSGAISFGCNGAVSALRTGTLFFIPASNPFSLLNSGSKTAYISMSTVFYTM